MATLKTLATQLGVSISTVSLALDGSPKVSEATRKRVQALADELQYTPNPTARALRTRRPDTIAFVHSRTFFPRGSWYGDLIQGIEEVLAERKWHLSLPRASSKDTGDLASQMRRLILDSRCAGILAPMLRMDEEEVAQLATLRVPVVLLGVYPEMGEPWFNMACVGIENYASARRMTRNLVEMGHKKFSFIYTPTNPLDSANRLEGVRQELKEAGLKLSEKWVIHAEHHGSIEAGFKAADDLMKRGDMPTAVIGTTDSITAAAMQRLQEAGHRVPEDISVAAFDNSQTSRLVTPQLTSVDFHVPRVAREGASLLCDLVDGKVKNGGRQVLVASAVHMRASCAPPKS